MPHDCLASTGSSALVWLVAGLTVCSAGVVMLRWSRSAAVLLLPCLFLAALTTSDSLQKPVSAACSPAPSSILQGQLRIIGGTVSSAELPVVVATNGTTTVTAVWGMPEHVGSDVVVPFALPNLTPGDWSLDITESPSTSFEFSDSDLSFVVNSSRMLTGGPFNASTSEPISVAATGRSFEIAVTRS